jgi:hypothetical protein
MTHKVEVFDNYLPQDTLQNLQNEMLCDDFPWFYGDSKVGLDQGDLGFYTELFDFQFVHLFYIDHTPNSPRIEMLNPILDILNPCALVRIKANITFCTPEVIKFPLHTDHEGFNGKTAVFYLNTNNGYTEFESGDRVESVANRMVVFDSNLQHRGSTCSDSRYRLVLNFNYVPYD